jgi:protein-S-isoprenylcysteine O-methyltransferase Ste14
MSAHASPSTKEQRRSRWLLVPPPPLFIVTFVVATQLDHVARLRVVAEAFHSIARIAGFVAAGTAALFMLAAPIVLFVTHRTTIVPHGQARSLVTAGPYRLSRNPMYVGLMTLYFTMALVMNTLWPVLLLALPVWVLDRKIIPFEEANLARLFGEDYRAYQRRVRRWV